MDIPNKDPVNTTLHFLEQVYKLLKTCKQSDTLIIARDDITGEEEEFRAHKYILTSSSGYFAHKFYGVQNDCSSIKLSFSPAIVCQVLLFLYTDYIEISSFNQLEEIYRLSEKLEIDKLKDICKCHMSIDGVELNDILSRYEIALNEKLNVLLKICQNFVKNNTKHVLRSDCFINASATVVEDIIKQEELNVDSELEIIDAVLKWGSEACLKEQLPDDDFYKMSHIDNFIKYLRFLSLSLEEYLSFIDRSNILTNFESLAILLSIKYPETLHFVPSGFCNIRNPRSCPKPDSICTSNNSLQTVSAAFLVPNKALQNQDVPSSSILPTDCMASGDSSVTVSESKPKYIPTKLLQRKNCYFYVPLDKSCKVVPQYNITCSAHISLTRGFIMISGIELHVINYENKSSDKLEVFLELSNSLGKCVGREYVLKLKDNIFSLDFPKQEFLKPGCDLNIEVMVERIKYYQAKICLEKNSKQTMLCDHDIAYEICLHGNQSVDDGFICLISRIIYTPCFTD